MRHLPGDIIFVTNGAGKIFKSEIDNFNKDSVHLQIISTYEYENKLSNINLCIPKLKNTERFEFALEKCAEMGITNFFIYESSRSFARGEKIDRWNKILLAAMKQSLLSYLPEIKRIYKISELQNLDGELIIFEQNSDNLFKEYKFNKDKKYYLIFGPEGGLSPDELNLFNKANIFNLAENRLRSETAIIKAVSLL